MGNEIKHTPGPWITNDLSIEAEDRNAGPHTWVATCDSRGVNDRQDDEANAKLIAACPTMYGFISEKASAGDAEAKKILESIHA
jgi:hypothetical protein